MDKSVEEEIGGSLKPRASSHTRSNIAVSSILDSESTSKGIQRPPIGSRAADCTRIMKFTKELSVTTVTLGCESCHGVESHLICAPRFGDYSRGWSLNMNWQQGYAPTNSDRRDGVLRRKRLEYLDYVAQFYEIPGTECSKEEICMLHQIAMDCPTTVPDVTFIQEAQVQKFLERIVCT